MAQSPKGQPAKSATQYRVTSQKQAIAAQSGPGHPERGGTSERPCIPSPTRSLLPLYGPHHGAYMGSLQETMFCHDPSALASSCSLCCLHISQVLDLFQQSPAPLPSQEELGLLIPTDPWPLEPDP